VPVAVVAEAVMLVAFVPTHTFSAVKFADVITGSGCIVRVATFDAVVLHPMAPPVAPFLTST
jgi:hypothetical protein